MTFPIRDHREWRKQFHQPQHAGDPDGHGAFRRPHHHDQRHRLSAYVEHITNWSARVPLIGPDKSTHRSAYDSQEQPDRELNPGHHRLFQRRSVAKPENSLVISEIMYQPKVTNATTSRFTIVLRTPRSVSAAIN